MSRAAKVIKDARLKSGLTQTALARLSGITQSVISEYESGRREPSFTAVDRLLSATGFVIEVAPRSHAEQQVLEHVIARASALRRALAPLGVSRIRVFGSVARREDSPSSDVDLVVDVASSVGLFDLLQMRSEAERILGRPVDLVPNEGLSPEVRSAIERDGVTL
ncbi:helix-turn-helix domain-containing protein [Microbacterium sp. NPDC089695]|uniref:helix-turn-helix domain-containing protein n=1 Tax=Microbacterium sp. NPDC089695 TaxID=3364198 RepID=UPI0037FE6320